MATACKIVTAMQVNQTMSVLDDRQLLMDDTQWNELRQQLNDPDTKRLSVHKIETLPTVVKSQVIDYHLKRKRPLIASFVVDELRNELGRAGYQEGFCNDFFDYWILPEHQKSFRKKESPGGLSKLIGLPSSVDLGSSFVEQFNNYATTILDDTSPSLTKDRELSSPVSNSTPNISDQQASVPLSAEERSAPLGNAEYYTFYRELLSKAEIKLDDVIEEPLPCLEIVTGEQETTFASLGNFSLIVGKAKSRKTFLVSALVAALISNDTVMQKIRGRLPPNQRSLLYFDTEQHPGHVKRILRRIATLAGQQTLPTLRIFHLKKYPPSQRLNAIQVAIYDTTNLGAIIIDGIRDLTFDINDGREATDRATDLLRWTEETGAHLITIIHENKSSNNARGHLGSELVNKAETVVSVSRDPADKESSIVTAEYCRDKEFEPFAFSIDEDGLPYLVDVNQGKSTRGAGAEKSSISPEVVESLVRRAFAENKSLRFSELRTNLMEASEYVGSPLGKTKVEQLIHRLQVDGYLTKFKPTKERYEVYQLNPEKITIQSS